MSRMHGHGPDGDWSLEVERETVYWGAGVPWFGPVRCYLSMSLSLAEARELMETRNTGGISFSTGSCRYDRIHAKNIEVTEEEANRIARGEHPRDVLFWTDWPGWRITVVPDPLIGASP